jgi:hypothetical protein
LANRESLLIQPVNGINVLPAEAGIQRVQNVIFAGHGWIPAQARNDNLIAFSGWMN